MTANLNSEKTKKKRDRSKPYKFNIGDRVAERPKDSVIFGLRKETNERIAKYRTQRYGTVLGNFTKQLTSAKRTTSQKYVRVLWDGLQTPSDHAQNRLILENELPALLEEHYAL